MPGAVDLNVVLAASAIACTVLVFLFGLLFGVIAWFWQVSHKQTMQRIDKVTDVASEVVLELKGVTTQLSNHSDQLGAGVVEFQKIDKHLKEHDFKINQIDKRVGIIEANASCLSN